MAGNLIQEFLIQPGIYDVVSFENFRDLLPEKMRDDPDVCLIYKAFRKKRQGIHKQIKRSIAREYSNEQDFLPLSNDPTDINVLKHTVTEMEKKAAELEQDLEKLTRENKEIDETIEKSLENVQSFHDQFIGESNIGFETLQEMNRILENR